MSHFRKFVALVLVLPLLASCSNDSSTPKTLVEGGFSVSADDLLGRSTSWENWVRRGSIPRAIDIGIFRRLEKVPLTLKWVATDSSPVFEGEVEESVVSLWLTRSRSVPQRVTNPASYRYVAFTTSRRYDLQRMTDLFLTIHARAGGIYRVGDGTKFVTRAVSPEQISKEVSFAYEGSSWRDDLSYLFPVRIDEDPMMCVMPAFVGAKRKPVRVTIYILPCDIGTGTGLTAG